MGETAIGLASLALTVPGVIDLLSKYGQWISEKVATFNNAKSVWNELGDLGWSLSHGELRSLTIAAKSFYLEEGCDPGLKNSLELQVRKLADDVHATQLFLSKQDPAQLSRRIIFAISGERRAKELNKTLRLDQQGLSQIPTISDLKQRRMPNDLRLTRKRFVKYENVDDQPIPISSNLYVTRGDYREDPLEGPYQETCVIIERSVLSGQASEETLKETAALLHHRLFDRVSHQKLDVTPKAILPCLGYRLEPGPELVFAMPPAAGSPQTLQNLIASDEGTAHHPLDFRFQLAHKLSEAVLTVHGANLVHKNIRTQTILILKSGASAMNDDRQDTYGFGDVYLTDWQVLRDASGPTLLRGVNTWTENLYRHPKRQGVQVQERYNMGHDIYSLGVCLLEVGLWDLLVKKNPADGQPHVSSLIRAAAEVENYPDPDVALTMKLDRPTDVKNILLKLASAELPQRMGIGYHRLVAACLTALDQPSGFGAEVDFTKWNQAEQGVAFRDLVLSFFAEARLLG